MIVYGGFLRSGAGYENSLILNDYTPVSRTPPYPSYCEPVPRCRLAVAFPANRPLGLVCVRVSILTKRFGVCISSYIYNHTLHNLYVYAIRINHIYIYIYIHMYIYIYIHIT